MSWGKFWQISVKIKFIQLGSFHANSPHVMSPHNILNFLYFCQDSFTVYV